MISWQLTFCQPQLCCCFCNFSAELLKVIVMRERNKTNPSISWYRIHIYFSIYEHFRNHADGNNSWLLPKCVTTHLRQAIESQWKANILWKIDGSLSFSPSPNFRRSFSMLMPLGYVFWPHLHIEIIITNKINQPAYNYVDIIIDAR